MSTIRNRSGFTLPLALADALPVLLFSAGGIVIAERFTSRLFFAGIILCITAGLGKIIWKLLLAIAHRGYPILTLQFRILMPLGFMLIVLSVFICRNTIDWNSVRLALTGLPQAVFFIAGLGCMCIMTVFSVKLDDSARSNWIEQITNSIGQLMFLTGLLLI